MLFFDLSGKMETKMIKVTRLNDSVIVVNVAKIQSVQATPDTIITFSNHDKMMVKEPVEEIARRIADYQRTVNCKPDDSGEVGRILQPSSG
jgi:flagellar protein FlbD